MNYNCWQFMGDHPIAFVIVGYYICTTIMKCVHEICKTIKAKRDKQ